MNDPNDAKVQSEVHLGCLEGLYGDRFSIEMQSDLKAAMDTVVKTVVVLRSVPLSSYGDPSLPFTPFRKED